MIHVRSIVDFRKIDVYFHDKIERYVSPLSRDTTSKDPSFGSSNEVSFQTNIENKDVCKDIRKSVNIAVKHKDYGATIIFACINEKIVGVYCFSDLDKYVPYKFMNSIERKGRCGIIFHCRTSKMYRGRGIYSSALKMICDQYGPSFDNIIITANSNNAASKTGIVKSGFARKMRISCIKILNYEKAWREDSESHQ